MNFETWLQSDLTKPLKVQALHGVFFSADNAANLIGVEVYNNGTAASLSGTCVGYAIRADGGTLTITGTVSGNKASIVLPTSAYVIEGPLDIVIKVVSGSVKTTVGACRGYVQRATTDTIIDPGHVIPSLEELLAQIDACEQATDAANAAATNANSKATAANTATTRANNAAAALENMDATATTLSPGSSATASVSTVSGHYRLALGVPKGDIGPSPTITNTATAYQNSTSGTTIPTGTWQTTQPTTPQGQFLWIRTILTWNNGQTTTLYSVSRMGIDGSVMSVNNISPDANGNVTLTPANVGAVSKSGDTMTGDLTITKSGEYPSLIFKKVTDPANSPQQMIQPIGGTSSSGRIGFYQRINNSSSWEGYRLPNTDESLSSTVNYEILTSKVPVTIGQGGTGATAASTARYNLYVPAVYSLAKIASDSTHVSITAGEYVYVRKHDTLAEGLYIATTNIANGAALSTSNLTAVSGGGLNALKSSVDTLNSKITYGTVSDFNDFAPSGTGVTRRYGYCTGGSASNAPIAGGNITYRGYSEGVATYYTQHFTIEYATAVYYRGRTFIRVCLNGSFGPWREIHISDRVVIIQPNGSSTFSLPLYGRSIVTLIGYSSTITGMCFAIRATETTPIIKWLGEAPSQISITMDTSGVFTITNSSGTTTALQIEYN